MDRDGDGMADSWESSSGLDPEVDDSQLDPDGDGLTNADEFNRGTNPVESNAPEAPVPLLPEDGEEVTVRRPVLRVSNSWDPDGDVLTYSFEIYADSAMTQIVDSAHDVAEGIEFTEWTPEVELSENSHYWWRCRSYDGLAYSDWTEAIRFFVNTLDERPSVPVLSYPPDGSEVDNLRPVLIIQNSVDPDEDEILYIFQLDVSPRFSGYEFLQSEPLAEGENGTTSWSVPYDLYENTHYFWRAKAIDEHGLESEWMPAASFFVNTQNEAPSTPQIVSPVPGEEVLSTSPILVVENSVDPDEDSLLYVFEVDVVETFNSNLFISSGEIEEGDEQTSWQPELMDNTFYFWRVRAFDGQASSHWVNGSFFVNVENDPPSVPVLYNPSDGSVVRVNNPIFIILPSEDVDMDSLEYIIEVYADESMQQLIAMSPPITEDTLRGRVYWTVDVSLQEDTRYWWRAMAIDEHGLRSEWSIANSFEVNTTAPSSVGKKIIEDMSTGCTCTIRSGE
jgi:hypothetical protein